MRGQLASLVYLYLSTKRARPNDRENLGPKRLGTWSVISPYSSVSKQQVSNNCWPTLDRTTKMQLKKSQTYGLSDSEGGRITFVLHLTSYFFLYRKHVHNKFHTGQNLPNLTTEKILPASSATKMQHNVGQNRRKNTTRSATLSCFHTYETRWNSWPCSWVGIHFPGELKGRNSENNPNTTIVA